MLCRHSTTEIIKFISASGLPVQLCRMIDSGGQCWVSFHEVYTKLLSAYSKATLRLQFAKFKLETRPATHPEKRTLYEWGAVKTLAKMVLLIKVNDLCKAVRAVTSDNNLSDSLTTIPDLQATALDLEGQSLSKQVANAN